MSMHWLACCCVDDDEPNTDCCTATTTSTTCDTVCNEIRVTFAGITSCGCDEPFTDVNGWHADEYDVSQINGAFTVEFGVGQTIEDASLEWLRVGTIGESVATYWQVFPGPGDCESTPSVEDGDGRIEIQIDRDGAGWRVRAWHSKYNTNNRSGLLFDGTVAENADGDCEVIPQISSDLVVGDCSTDPGFLSPSNFSTRVAAYGGTATFEICP